MGTSGTIELADWRLGLPNPIDAFTPNDRRSSLCPNVPQALECLASFDPPFLYVAAICAVQLSSASVETLLEQVPPHRIQ